MLILKNWFSDMAYNAFRTLCATLCEAIYPVIGFSYKLFMELATFRLLKSETMATIFGRITMILTIVMVFYITFEFVKYTIEPDKMTDKEKGVAKLPQKMLAVVILITFIPNIFTYLFYIQNTIIRNDTISKIILGKTYSVEKKSNQNDEYTTFGNNFSWQILNLFYNTESSDTCDSIPCDMIVLMNQKDLINNGKLVHMALGINSMHTEQTEDGTIEVANINFSPLWAVIVGGFIAYMLILYCIDVGARTIQMVYLEFIAPIAIVGILSPKKENIFQKWLKQLLTTYLDVFIRLVLINFIVLISESLLLNMTDVSSKTDNKFIIIALILGLLVFAKRVPKMLGELFPSQGTAGGNFGLKPGDRNLGRVIGAALGISAGAAAGFATGIAQGARKAKSLDQSASKGRKAWAAISGGFAGGVRGTVGGAGRGLWNGAKESSNKSLDNLWKNSTAGAKSQAKSNKLYGNRQASGYTLDHQVEDSFRSILGLDSRVDKLENEKAPVKRRQDAYQRINQTYNDMASEAEKQVEKGAGKYSGELQNAKKNLQNMTEDKEYNSKVRNKINNKQYLDNLNVINNRTDLTDEQKVAEIKTLQERMKVDGTVTDGTFKYAEMVKQIEARTDLTDDQKLVEMGKALQSTTNAQVNADLRGAEQAVKKAKDKAVFDFITHGKYLGTDAKGNDMYEVNATIDRARSELKNAIDAHNKEEGISNRIDTDVLYEAINDGELFDALIKGAVVKDNKGNVRADYSQKDEEGYKVYGIGDQISKAKRQIDTITTKQEAVKRETTGSGVAGDKK